MFDDMLDETGQAPLDIPGLPAPQNMSSPQPSFEDSFEQNVLAQLQGSTPEEILKRKISQYFEELGVKQGTKKAKLASALKEAGRSMQGTKEQPYIPTKDLLKRESQLESDKLLPVLQREAATIYGQKKVESQTASKERIEAAKISQAERTNTAKAELQRLKLAAESGVRGANEARLAAQTKLLEEESKNYKKKFETPEMRNFTFAQEMSEKYGDDFSSALKNFSGFKDASSSPSTSKMVAGNSPEEWKQSLSRLMQLDKSKQMFKPKPSGNSNTGTWSEAMRMRRNPATGKMEKYIVLRNNKTAQYMDPDTKVPLQSAGRPFDQKTLDVDDAADIGEKQRYNSINSLASLVSTGQDKKVSGPEGGNAFAQFLRSLEGTTLSLEGLSNVSTKNAVLAHTKTMFGGRFPISAADALEKISGKQYSIQAMRLANSDDPRAEKEEDPRLVNRIKDATETFIKQSYDNKKFKDPSLHRYEKLPRLEQLIDTLDIGKSETPLDNARKKLGLSNAQ